MLCLPTGVSHCSSTAKVVMLNYTENPGRGGVGLRGWELSACYTQHAVCLPGSFPPALIPDTARCQREPAIRREKERRGQKIRGVGVKEMGTERAAEMR